MKSNGGDGSHASFFVNGTALISAELLLISYSVEWNKDNPVSSKGLYLLIQRNISSSVLSTLISVFK